MSSLTSIIVSIFSVIILAAMTVLFPVEGSRRAFFVFGDSLVDSGNNNFLATTARADSPPYGIDYPDHRPTGRFSNGYNIPDLISLAIGEEPTLAYLDPRLKGQKLLVGANFASAGIGILNDTGFQFVNIIRMHKQFQFFVEYQRRLTAIIGEERTRELVNGALVLITIGGNDFVNNYFLAPVTVRRLQYNIQGFCQLLISELRNILKRMYDLGARRVLVTGIGPLGCVPAELATRSPNGECAFEPQRATAIYNDLMGRMIADLNRQLGNNNTFIAVNAVDKAIDLIHNPRAYGFVNSKVACCGQGPYNGIGLCTVASSLCRNRSQYVFWDSFHPTEQVNKIIVETILNGGERFMSPMNLSTIMMLDSIGL